MVEHFTHHKRVNGPQEAAALVRDLGATRVRVTQRKTRAWVLVDPPAIARVLAAVEPRSSTTIAIEGITREATAPLLAALVVADAQFLTIAGTTATLRVWPRRDEAFVDEIELPRASVFERVREALAVTWINGQISEPGDDAVALLPRIYAELDQPELEIDLDASVDGALALALELPYTEVEWTAGVVIDLPSGELSTYAVEPPAGFEATWRERIERALERIRKPS